MKQFSEDAQWASTGAGYMPVGRTLKSIPAGIYTINHTPQGPAFAPATVVSDSIVVLRDSPAYQVIGSIEKFWQAKDRFKALGLTHKRGALLHGTPGSGKTAAIILLSRELVARGGIVILAGKSPHGLGSGLKALRSLEPDRPLVCVLEDVEEMIAYDETALLSLLDGEDQVDGVVFLATTNYIGKIPKRIMDRPSRFDDVVFVGNPCDATRRAYLRSRVDSSMLSDAELEHWVSQTEGFTIAYLKEVVVAVLALDQRLEDAVARLRGMRKDAAEVVPITAKGKRRAA